MTEPTIQALATAMDASSKAASSPGLLTALDRLMGFRLSEWKAQGDVVRQQILDGYKEAQEKGLGMQYATAFREKANVLNTLTKATEYVKKDFSRDVAFDEDVFWNLIDHAKTISQEEVQDLIAQIIAGEYNEPGTYSMSTIQTLKLLGRNELEAFERIGSAMILDGVPVDFFHFRDGYKEDMVAVGIDFNVFLTLQGLGLFNANSHTTQINTEDQPEAVIAYFDKTLIFHRDETAPSKVNLPSLHGISPVGRQIMSHLKPKFNERFYEWLQNKYQIPHYAKK